MLVYSISTIKLATKLPPIWGTTAQATTARATTAPIDNCTLLSHFKLDSNGMKKAKLFYSGSTTQLATKVALIGETTAKETTGPVDD